MVARKQNVKVREVQDFVVGQLEEARKRIQKLEKELVVRGREQQKELEGLIARVRSGKELKQLEKRASLAGTQLRRRFEDVQAGLVHGLGLASKDEIRQLNRDLLRLSKKVDGLARRLGVGEGATAHRAVN